tara:strand:- start:412 stop:1074 length:663 start_codon:yes stop_codon:yes gene_type:complete
MIFSGDTYRQIGSAKRLSFNASGITFNNITGSAELGFSGAWNGTPKALEFSFSSGKLMDPENRYIYSYLSEDPFSISGDINDDYYQYYINEQPVCFGQQKDQNVIENFYVKIRNCTLDADIKIYADAPSYSISQPSSFPKTGSYAINVTNKNSNLPFTIFSGDLLNTSLSITNLPLRVTGNSDIIVTGDHTTTTGNFAEEITLYSSAGNITGGFNVEITE